MDYSLLTEQQLQKKYDSLPDNLREILDSENVAENINQIAHSHYLDEERTIILKQLTTFIILGFLSVEELNQEIQENLHLNPKHSSELTQEIDRKIFSPIKMDLEKAYNPVAEMPKTPETSSTKPEPFIAQPPAELPVAGPAEPFNVVQGKPPVVSEVEPFILHQETEFNPIAEKKRVSFPAIGWFKKPIQEKSKIPESPAKVELETAGIKPEEKKESVIAKTEPPKQKVIHYKETGVPTPFGKIPETPAPIKPPETPKPSDEAKVINLDSFE